VVARPAIMLTGEFLQFPRKSHRWDRAVFL